MGLPVLHGVAGESADIVREEGVGIVFEPENATQLLEKLQFLQCDTQAYEGFQAHCLEAAKKYNRTALAMKMLASVSKLLGREYAMEAPVSKSMQSDSEVSPQIYPPSNESK